MVHKNKAVPKKKAVSRRKARNYRATHPASSFKDLVCAGCGRPMESKKEWDGDIEAALALLNAPSDGSKKICSPCGELFPELIQDALRKVNRRRPSLRLGPWPWPERCVPFGVPIPNVNICIEYFDRYISARSEEDALRRISDLLLELRRKHPVEWECCGWKSDAIADVALGRTASGYVEGGSVTAQCWMKELWAHEKRVERQIEIDLSAAREKASDALFELELLRMSDDLTMLKPKKSYNVLARFISWLNDNHANCANTAAAARRFLRDRPNLTVAENVLIELAKVYDAIRERDMNRGAHRVKRTQRQSDAVTNLQPSVVIQEFVARRHGISSRLVAQVRAELRKN